MTETNLTHFDASGNAVMVDVSEKTVTFREATAHGIITMNAEAFAAVESGTVKKGDVLGVARIAGIMATKRTSELIPLCHPLPLTKVSVDFRLLPERQAVEALCTVKTAGVTGVEMEALTGVSTALLTIYDMCKAVDKGMELGVARIAGIMATKRTSELIPLCHPLPLTKVSVDFRLLPERQAVEALCTVKTAGVTGVEMEALTGVSTALLTIYDMCKAVDKGMELGEIHLVEKTGGKSGHYIRAEGGYV